jgi:hypothetical protein
MEYFNGMRNNGTWTLNVTDKVSGNSGQLNKFELKFYNNISINISRGNPIEDYNDTDGSIVFDFKCFSYNNISIIQLWTNTTGTWHANYTNSSAQGYTNNTWLNVSVSGIPDGNNYKWGVYCNDTFGNSERSNNRTFSVDVTSPPSIILNSPSQYSNSTSIGFNCSATDIGGLANISLWINTTNGWGLNETSNVSGNSNSSRFDKNLSSNSTYFWTCRACDEQGNCDISANQSLVIDENAPELSLIEPENEKVFGAGTESIVFNWTTHDDYNSSIDCTIYTKAAYQDTKSCENATTCEQTISGFTSGAYTWKINCSDGANQKISSERSFSILQAQRDGGGGGGGALPPTLNGTPENETN